MLLNIIHLSHIYFEINSKPYNESLHRRHTLMCEMGTQNIDYLVWDGIYNEKSPHKGIMASHKAIVLAAKQNGYNEVAIAEDDIRFYAPGAWDYFLKRMPETFDLYLGTSYHPIDYPDGRMNFMFDSMTLYIIRRKFYDDFLSLPEDMHIDRAICKLNEREPKEIFIVQPYVCEQYDGYSFNAAGDRQYKWRMEDKKKYGLSS